MKCAAVVLAAGNSTRMGEQKVLLSFNGVTVIEHIVARLAASTVSETIVVVGRDAESIRSALINAPVTIVDNPDYEQGMLSSVRSGLAAVKDRFDASLICLGDQPAIQTSAINAVVRAGSLDGSRIIVPVYRDRRGHPLYIPSTYWPKVTESYDGTGLRGLLDEFSDDVQHLSLDESWILDDMDYPVDYQRELERLENGD
ncbi:MAG: nucleotidyltransferase family protein [Candidatus Hydrogenedentota bacterium]